MSKIDDIIQILKSAKKREERDANLNNLLGKEINKETLEEIIKEIDSVQLIDAIYSNYDLGRIFLGNLLKKYGIE